MLKPMEPLPYDYVDELIDEQVEFYMVGTKHMAKRRDGRRTMHTQQMFQLKEDIVDENVLTMDAWSWTPDAWSDERVDEYLKIGRGREFDWWNI